MNSIAATVAAADGRSRGRSTRSSRRRPRPGDDQQPPVPVERAQACATAAARSRRRSAAEAIRSQATPSTSTRANSRTANGGPEVVEDGAAHEIRLRRDGVECTDAGRTVRRHGSGDADIVAGAASYQGESKVLDSHLSKNGSTANHPTDRRLLDDIDRRILTELEADGRLFAELGRRVSLSSPAVAARVQRLERERVITGYRAEIDPRALGYQLTAIVRIKPRPASCRGSPSSPRRSPRSASATASPARTASTSSAPAIDRRARRLARSLPRLRPDDDVDRQRLADPTARPADRRGMTRTSARGSIAKIAVPSSAAANTMRAAVSASW